MIKSDSNSGTSLAGMQFEIMNDLANIIVAVCRALDKNHEPWEQIVIIAVSEAMKSYKNESLKDKNTATSESEKFIKEKIGFTEDEFNKLSDIEKKDLIVKLIDQVLTEGMN